MPCRIKLTRRCLLSVIVLAPFNPRGTDVSVVLDLTIHDLDIVLSFVADRVSSIRAVGVPVISQSIDIANVRLEFENGCVANITTSRVSVKMERKIRFFQKDAYFSVDMLNKTVDLFRKKADISQFVETSQNGYTTLKAGDDPASLVQQLVAHERITSDKIEPLHAELSSFVDCVREGKPPLVSGAEGRRALELAYEIIRIIQTESNKLVTSDEYQSAKK